jgi:hypothetical protein
VNNLHVYIRPLATLLLFTAVLSALSLYFEIDHYRGPFFKASLNHSIFDLRINYEGEAGFSFLQNVAARFMSFEFFAVFCIFLALTLKMIALLAINKNPTLLSVLPYILVLSFLHEAIQIRAAIALSIVFIAIIYLIRDKKLSAWMILLLAASFHISALIFGAVFLVCELFDRYKEKVFYMGLVVIAAIIFAPSLPDILIGVGEMFNSRHNVYIGRVDQNRSGLFSYFYLFVAALTFLIWYLFKPKDELWNRLYRLSVISGCLAFTTLFVFHFSVVIASRLADVLIFPLVVVMGALLVQLKDNKRYFLLGTLIFGFVSYSILRGIVSFRPNLYLAG